MLEDGGRPETDWLTFKNEQHKELTGFLEKRKAIL
jgi:hypothetical protein